MSMNKNDKLENSDIENIINKINQEVDRRFSNKSSSTPHPGYASLPPKESYVDNNQFDNVKGILDSINNMHCFCETNRRGEHSKTGSGRNVDFRISNIPENEVVKPIAFQAMEEDIDELSAQCACDSVSSPECSCDTHCSCQSNCTCDSQCTCNSQCACQSVCGCQGVCTCNAVYTCSCVSVSVTES